MKKMLFPFTKILDQLFIAKLTLAAILILSGIGQISGQASVTTPPEILDFKFTPSTIDTTDNSQTVTITVHAVDAVKGVGSVVLYFQSLSTKDQFVFVAMDSRQRISGNDKDGVYSAAANFPQYSKAGVWQVSRIRVFSATDYTYKTFAQSDLVERGFATQLQVISNNEDTAPPEILDFRINPSTINMTDGSQNAAVIIRAVDVKAGVRAVAVNFHRNNNFIEVIHPVYLDSSSLVTGNEKDGVYRSRTTFSRNSTPGMYSISVNIVDKLGNNKTLYPNDLADLGFNSQLQLNVIAAPSVSLGGRILTAAGQGVSGGLVALTDTNRNVRYTAVSPFGYYRFDRINIWETYTLKVIHKRHTFNPQTFFLDSQQTNLNIMAIP